jgi:hypothetical protein
MKLGGGTPDDTEKGIERLGGLQGELEPTKHASGRLRIHAALENQMRAVLEELQPNLMQKTPEERLHLLRESRSWSCRCTALPGDTMRPEILKLKQRAVT